MSQFLKNIFLFILAIVITYPIVIGVWGSISHYTLKGNIKFKKGAYGYLDKRIKDANSTANVDVLFLGSSLCYRGFDNRIFTKHGLSSFNFGSSAQTHSQTNYILQRYIDRLNPKLIIYEVSPLTLTSDGIESSLDIIANMPFETGKTKFITETENIALFNTLIFSLFANASSSSEEIQYESKDTYIKGGFTEREIEFGTHDSINIPAQKTLPYKDYQLKAFKENLELISKAQAKVVLVRAPTTTSRYRNIAYNFSADSLLRSYGTLYNFNELMELDDSLYFYDKTHLNQHGVELFNEQLIEILQKDGHIDNFSAQ